VDSTVTARAKRSQIISNHTIQAGDVIVGLASFGQAKYEKEYNGGMGSNGLTSARHDVFSKQIAKKYPETYDNALNDSVVYVGSYNLTDTIEIEGKQIPMGKLVLSPTRTYAPIMKKILTLHSKNIHGLVHCSGGGQTKVLHFAENVHIIKDNLFDVPPLFEIIQKESQTAWKEMYQVFNMGHRMEIYLPEQYAQEIIQISESFGVDAQIVGRVEASEGTKLTIKTDKGIFEY